MTEPVTAAAALTLAELRAEHARERFQHTVAQLQHRLDPRPRAQRAARDARIVGETAAAIVRQQPATTGGVVAGTVLAAAVFVARHRIARLFAGKRADAPPAHAGLIPVTRTDP